MNADQIIRHVKRGYMLLKEADRFITNEEVDEKVVTAYANLASAHFDFANLVGWAADYRTTTDVAYQINEWNAE